MAPEEDTGTSLKLQSMEPAQMEWVYADGLGRVATGKATVASKVAGSYNVKKSSLPSRVRLKTGQMDAATQAEAKRLWKAVQEIEYKNNSKEVLISEFDYWLTAEEKSKSIVSHVYGNYEYTAVNGGHGNYKFFKERYIRGTGTREEWMDEVLSEVIGDDWEKYVD